MSIDSSVRTLDKSISTQSFRMSDLSSFRFNILRIRSVGRIRGLAMVASQDDWENVFGKLAEPPVDSVSLKRKADEQGTREKTRENLRVYETMPAQLLNAYGMAAFSTMEKEKVWEEVNKPLKTGAKYMTELCSAEEERRGVGINRFLQVLVEYLKYQKTDGMIKQNKFILKDEIYAQLYKEIEMIYNAAVYCLAGKKQYQRKGASSLRSGVSFDPAADRKCPTTLKDQAKILYNWIGIKQSRLRMLMAYQSAGGLPFVSATHLLGVQCFLSCGNAYHETGDKTVSLEVFQNAIAKRHEMEIQGHMYLKADDDHADFS